MEKQGISIIVPIYNTEKYLDRCISSLIHQSYKMIEIILVDDGSTDNSSDVCKKYQKRDERIKLISQSNKGQSAARLTGLKNSKYDFIGFVDSDDWVDEEMFNELMDKVNKYGCDIVSSGFFREFESNGRIQEIFDCYEEGLYDDLDRDIYISMLWNENIDDYGMYCSLWTKIFKKEILEEVLNEIDKRVIYGEDALTFYSYMLKCKSAYVIKKSYYHYCVRQNSISRTPDERFILNSYYLYSGLKEAFMDSGNNRNSLMKQLKNYVLHIEEHLLKQMYEINTRKLIPIGGYNELNEKRVIIYGAGEYGRLVYRYLKHNVNCEIIAWADSFPESKEMKCLHQIISPYEIKRYTYDYILIAVWDCEMAKDIRRSLVSKYGVNDDIIIWKENIEESVFKDIYIL